MDDKALIEEAILAREKAYAPYSHFRVGAALLTGSGTVYRGCNIENAGYTPSVCAERTAFFKAVSEGERDFCVIAIVAGKEDGVPVLTAPCGVCRQVMTEFCDSDTFRIVMAVSPEEYQVMTLKELFPCAFGPEDLKNQKS